jgi:PTH1 family peptidyl-tRNA hydrolase
MIEAVVGLGNIGQKYADTRHNLGFELINKIANEWNIRPKPGPGEYFWAEHNYAGRMISLIWPTTYMNNSGLAVAQFLEETGLEPEQSLIVYDDIALPLGKLRIRLKGSAGGHNGIASIIEHLGTDDIPRLRLGMGLLPENADQVAFVLGRFSIEEREIADKMIGQAAEAVLYSLQHSLVEAMNKYNSNPAPEE